MHTLSTQHRSNLALLERLTSARGVVAVVEDIRKLSEETMRRVDLLECISDGVVGCVEVAFAGAGNVERPKLSADLTLAEFWDISVEIRE